MSEAKAGALRDIADLASTDPRVREAAAHALFRIGCGAAEPLLKQWFADRDFRALASSSGTLLTVGVAVEPERFQAIRRSFGEPRLANAPPDQEVLEFEVNFAHGVRLDILTASDRAGRGPIARFLERFGEGIQQVGCDVRDVARASEVLRSRFGLDPLYPEPRAGADDSRVNFFLAPLAEGRKILIELVEVRSAKTTKKR